MIRVRIHLSVIAAGIFLNHGLWAAQPQHKLFQNVDKQLEDEEGQDTHEIPEDPGQVYLKIRGPLPFQVSVESDLPTVKLSGETFTLSEGSVVKLTKDQSWSCPDPFDVQFIIYQDKEAPNKHFHEDTALKLCAPYDVLKDSDVEYDISGAGRSAATKGKQYSLYDFGGGTQLRVWGYNEAGRKGVERSTPYLLPSRNTPTRDYTVHGPWREDPAFIVIQPKGSEYKYLALASEARNILIPVATVLKPQAASPNYYQNNPSSTHAKAYQQGLEKKAKDEARARQLSATATERPVANDLKSFAKYLYDHSAGYNNKLSSKWYHGKIYFPSGARSLPDHAFNQQTIPKLDTAEARLIVPSDRCKAGILQFGNKFCYVLAKGTGESKSSFLKGRTRNGVACRYGAENYHFGSLPINPPKFYYMSNHGKKSSTKSYGKLSTTYLSPSVAIRAKDADENRDGLLIHSGRESNGSIEARITHGCLRIDPDCQSDFNKWRDSKLAKGERPILVPKEINLSKELGMGNSPALDERLLLGEILDENLISYIQ